MEKAAVELEDLEAFLISRSAKTFKELRPGGKEQNNQHHSDRECQDENGLDFEDYGTKFMLPRPALCGEEKAGMMGSGGDGYRMLMIFATGS